jgi:Flp pilus assembly pilin Flp
MVERLHALFREYPFRIANARGADESVHTMEIFYRCLDGALDIRFFRDVPIDEARAIVAEPLHRLVTGGLIEIQDDHLPSRIHHHGRARGASGLGAAGDHDRLSIELHELDFIGVGDLFAQMPSVNDNQNVVTMRLAQFGMDESGADLIEYALLVGLIAGACALTFTGLRTTIVGLFGTIAASVSDDFQ